MDFCFVNLNQLRNFKFQNEIKIKLVIGEYDPRINSSRTTYLVNGKKIKFMQKNRKYSMTEEMEIIRSNFKEITDGFIFLD